MDYTAFTGKVTLSSSLKCALRRLRQYSGSSRTRKIISIIQALAVTIFVVTSFLFFILSLSAYLKDNVDVPLFLVAFFAGLFTLILVLVVQGFTTSGKHIAIMERFANDNNFTFHPWVRVDSSQGFAFSVTSQRLARNGVTGVVGKRTFWLYEYRFMTGSYRAPYPNIFTVLKIHLDKSYQQTLLLNKDGRLKMIWPRGDMKKIDTPWYHNEKLRLYAENRKVDPAISKLLTPTKLNELMQISPKIEVQVHESTLALFVPGMPVPTKQVAEKLLSFAKNL